MTDRPADAALLNASEGSAMKSVRAGWRQALTAVLEPVRAAHGESRRHVADLASAAPRERWEAAVAYREQAIDAVVEPLARGLAEADAVCVLETRYLGTVAGAAALSVAAAHADEQRALARTVVAMETALVRWGRALLSAEAALDQPRFHSPTEDDVPAVVPAPVPEDVDGDPASALVDAAAQLQDALDAAIAPTDGGHAEARPVERETSDDKSDAEAAVRTEADRWRSWYDEVVANLDFLLVTLRFRSTLRALLVGVLDDVTRNAVAPVLEGIEAVDGHLAEGGRRADMALAAAEHETGTAQLRQSLERLGRQTAQGVDGELRGAEERLPTTEFIATVGQAQWELLQQEARALPGPTTIHVLAEALPNGAKRRRRVVNPSQMVLEAMAPPWPQQLGGAARALVDGLRDVWDQVEQVSEIPQYGVQAALDELGRGARRGRPGPGRLGQIQELASDGFVRARERLVRRREVVQRLTATFSDQVFRAFAEDWEDLFRRFASDAALEERFVGLTTRLARLVERWGHLGAARLDRIRTSGLRLFRVGMRVGRRVLRRGRAAMGVERAEPDLYEASRAYRDAEELARQFPLVYRLLFAPHPITTPSLLVGRSRELVRVRGAVERWHEERGANVCLLVGDPGTGATSLLNALETRALSGHGVRRLTLMEPVRTEEELARALWSAIADPSEPVPALDAMPERLRARDDVSVVLLDGIERVARLRPRGLTFLTRLLDLFRATEPHVFWIASVNRPFWVVARSALQLGERAIVEVELAPFDRKLLVETIEQRHMKSGIPLEFTLGSPPRWAVMGRLTRRATVEDRQRRARGEFFADLCRAAGQQPRLALFHWFRSSEYGDAPEVIRVKPFRDLPPPLLSGLDLTSSFVLRAVYLHGVLSEKEIAEVCRTSPTRVHFVLEQLDSLGIMEPRLDDNEGVGGETGWGIHPLLVEAVRVHLENLHVLY